MNPTNISSHMSAARARTSLVENTGMACRSGCGRPRKGFAAYCKHCLPGFKRLGHPKARSILPKEHREQEKAVLDLFNGQPDHPGLVYVLQALQAWMAEASEAAGLPAKKWPHPSVDEVARLSRYGISACELLVRLCAISAFLRSSPQVLPDDTSRAFAVSLAVLRLAPRQRRASRTPKGSQWAPRPRFAAVQHLGKHLTEWFSPFTTVVVETIGQREKQAASVQEAMRQPFAVPAAAILSEAAP